MNSIQLEICLSSWIIQDGNYEDFVVGTLRSFALEFYAAKGMAISHASPALEFLGDANYRACGEVVFANADAWVCGFGDVLAFQDRPPPKGVSRGSSLEGSVSLGIDPFFYFEQLSRLPGIPALIYQWRVDAILMQTAPFIDGTSPDGRQYSIRDVTKSHFAERDRTDAWHDDGGFAEYVLRCTRLPVPPVYRL